MNTTHTPITTSGPSIPRPRRRWRERLIALVVFAATLTLFYTEENWRGHRAWENCKRQLEAKGAKLDWNNYIPQPVPDNENFFGVPEMQKWFVGRGKVEGAPDLHYPAWDADPKTSRVVVANVTFGLPKESPPGGLTVLQTLRTEESGAVAATPPSGSTVLNWTDRTNAQADADRLIKEALGPMAYDPIGYNIMLRKPEDVRPAQFFMQFQTLPTIMDVQYLLPKEIGARDGNYLTGDSGQVRVDPTGSNTYRVSIFTPLSASDYATWGEKIAPSLAIIQQAVQRPYAVMLANYQDITNTPIPNFVTMRTMAQRLAALAECDLLLGQPEKALQKLTFLHQLRRILEFRPSSEPMTLVSAMINVAVAGLYVNTIQDGLRMQAWREPQLAALELQLKEIQLRPYVVDGFAFEQADTCTYGERLPASELAKLFRLPDNEIYKGNLTFFKWLYNSLMSRFSFYSLVPRGWVYQNMVVDANLHQLINDAMASPGQLVDPSKFEPVLPIIERATEHATPFNVLARIAIPNFSKACQTMSHNQTLVSQARIACALERYRLAHGEFPPTLDALTPQFIDKIPLDIIGGQPPHYRRSEDGKFLLYSIGWSEKDHGGQMGKDGDWVWGDPIY